MSNPFDFVQGTLDALGEAILASLPVEPGAVHIDPAAHCAPSDAIEGRAVDAIFGAMA